MSHENLNHGAQMYHEASNLACLKNVTPGPGPGPGPVNHADKPYSSAQFSSFSHFIQSVIQSVALAAMPTNPTVSSVQSVVQ